MPICKYEQFLSLIKFKNRILGFDHGTKNIGVAISNEDLTLATPLKTITRKKILDDFDEILTLINDYRIKGIVFGWPLNMNGSRGPRCQSVETFVKKFLNFKNLKLHQSTNVVSSHRIASLANYLSTYIK